MKIVEYVDIPMTKRAGGVGTYMRSVGRELVRRGHTVVIVDGASGPKLFSNRHLVRTLNDADVHHFQEPSTAFLAYFAKNCNPQNSVITFHAPVASTLVRTIYSPVIRCLYRKSNAVLTTTKRNAKILRLNGSYADVIPLWADEFFVPPFQTCYLRKPYVLSACVVDHFHEYKNYALISKLGKLLKTKFNLTLVHVGLHDFDIPYVTHVGVVDRNRLRQFYQEALLLVLPSIGPYEGFGLVAVEALACGTPVLVSDGCGISEFLDDSFVSPLNEFEKKLFSMVADLLKDPCSIIDKAYEEKLKFSYDNCRKTADIILKSAQKS